MFTKLTRRTADFQIKWENTDLTVKWEEKIILSNLGQEQTYILIKQNIQIFQVPFHYTWHTNRINNA